MLIIVIHYHYNTSKIGGSKGFFLFFARLLSEYKKSRSARISHRHRPLQRQLQTGREYKSLCFTGNEQFPIK
jgi:hypothetical protein